MGNRIQIDFTFDDSTKTNGKYLVFDIETTGFPINKNASPADFKNWPFVVQIAWLLFDDEKKLIEHNNSYMKQSVLIPADATNIHGITTEMMQEKGIEPLIIYASFKKAVDNTEYIISHNIDFDIPIVHCDFLRNGMKWDFPKDKMLCTMKAGANFCRIPFREGEYKWPKLTELYQKCFYPGHKIKIFNDTGTSRYLHDANIDTSMTAKCFFKLMEHGFFKGLKTAIISNSSPAEYIENNLDHLHRTEGQYWNDSYTKLTIEIHHVGLGVSRAIRDDEERVYGRVAEQFRKWDVQYLKFIQRKKAQTDKESSFNIAEERTREAQEKLRQIEDLLIYTIDIDDTVTWDSLKDNRQFDVPNPKYNSEGNLRDIYDIPQPAPPTFRELPIEPDIRLYKPDLSIIDNIFESKKTKKIEQAETRYQEHMTAWKKSVDEINAFNSGIKEQYEEKLKEYENKKQAIIKRYDDLEEKWKNSRDLFYNNQTENNEKIDKLKASYFNKDAEAVIQYCETVLYNSKYPDTFPKDFDIDYNPVTRSLIVEYFLPTPDDLPSIKEVKYISSKKELKELLLSETQILKNYDSAIYKITLRTMHELFEADKAEALDEIIFNGWVKSINKATGNGVITCILTIQAKKGEFSQIELSKVDQKLCFDNLKGIGGDRFSRIKAVQPIAQIKR